MTYKTTKKDFEYFKSRCEYWQKRLNLMSWRLDITCEKIDENSAAETTAIYQSRVAAIRLNKEFDFKPLKISLNTTALHECLEVLTSTLMCLAKARVWDEEEYIKENHTVIRVLEKLLMDG